MSDDSYLQLLTLGDSGVGKSWLLLRWADPNQKFNKTNSMPTIGIDFKQKTLDINGKKLKVQVWDTAGQERFRTITDSYYRKAQGILLVYDITNRLTFENMKIWMKQIQTKADSRVCTILVGNKCDLVPDRTVSISEGEALALEYKIPFFETSALSNINVMEAFQQIASDVKHRMDSGTLSTGGKIGSSSTSSTSSSSGGGHKNNSATISGSDLEAPSPAKKRGWC